ncbi:MAG TPA: DUF5686 and carboxypeptidase regulatory-like domain-containing protein [Flavisolibacter sp.]|nr:DUF5686 and carboxypeptidase regulatory-like domain-containing protein [Flavisolibacter sp.]
MKQFLFLILLMLAGMVLKAQSFKIYGKITNNKQEPLAFVSVQLQEQQNVGTTTKEDGKYGLNLEVGRYNLVVSMIGYKTQILNVVLTKDLEQNIVLEEEDQNAMEDIVIRVKVKDRAEEIMRNVIRNKEANTAATNAYSAKLYIKAIQQDSVTRKRDRAKTDSALFQNPDAEFEHMAMTEVLLQLDYESDQRMKEKKLAVKKHGSGSEDLFYLSATQGNFNFYNNLIKVPAISTIPFLSPVSYSGLLAYRFKTLKTERRGDYKIFTISVKPRQLSNATVEGEITISDSSWAILHTRFSFPEYHLPEYDFFEVVQDYGPVDGKSWVMTRQQFNYYSKTGRKKLSGQTLVVYSDYELNKSFGRSYFGTEVSATAQSAYEKDSSFWKTVRTEPLTAKEIRYVRYRDSVYQVTHSEAYLDSLDRVNNRITWKKLGFLGQTFYNRSRERTWVIPPIVSLYAPFQFGGGRIRPSFYYYKRYASRKDITLFADLSYGIRNKDINGGAKLKRMYNPFNRGFYMIEVNRDFDRIYEGDAWINQIQRSSYFLNNFLALGHGLELANGLYAYTEANLSLRRSVNGYKTNSRVDSLFGDFLDNNQPVAFDPYNAFYSKITVKYTPRQRYIREPREKIILGSKWPTFYVSWNRGIPDFLSSEVEFDYLEFGLEQTINLGIMGNTRYTAKTGSFIHQKDLKQLDYHWQRRGDPFLFMNPDEAFQALDSTFPVFKRFYQGHMMHEFNGAFLNKIPLLKKLQLREIAGGGFLIAPERNLTYAELFAGIERVFKWPFNPLTKFKVGVYVVGSVANQFSNPVQFKVGLTTWNWRKNKWR